MIKHAHQINETHTHTLTHMITRKRIHTHTQTHKHTHSLTHTHTSTHTHRVDAHKQNIRLTSCNAKIPTNTSELQAVRIHVLNTQTHCAAPSARLRMRDERWRNKSGTSCGNDPARTATPRRSPQRPHRRSDCKTTTVYARWHCTCAGSHTPHGRMIRLAHQINETHTLT